MISIKKKLRDVANSKAMFLNVFAGTQFGLLLDRYPITSIDVGSRNGFDPDLLPIASGVNGITFEPDEAAFERLRKLPVAPWRSMRHLPIALDRVAGERKLSIPRHAGSASLLEHDLSLGRRFNKTSYFDVQATIPVFTKALDDVLPRDVRSPAYLKLDVEGLELAILEGAPNTIDELVALKLEVSFLPFRRTQPLAWDVAQYVWKRGFELMELIRPACWRIFDTALDGPRRTSIPFSKGQLAHGDYLFFREPSSIRDEFKRFEAAALAMCYGFFDHAAACLGDHATSRWLRVLGVGDPIKMVSEASSAFARAERQYNLRQFALRFKHLVLR